MIHSDRHRRDRRDYYALTCKAIVPRRPDDREPLIIELGWPAKQLSPNNRVHHMVYHRYAKAAKIEAGWATKIARPFDWGHDGPFDIHVTAYPPKNWSTGDNDNLVARLKHHFDGIADVLGVNDRQFNAPTVKWADKTEHGMIVIAVREA